MVLDFYYRGKLGEKLMKWLMDYREGTLSLGIQNGLIDPCLTNVPMIVC